MERFIWTDHAAKRLSQRGLARAEVERAIRDGHEAREANRGEADWRIHGTRADGRDFAVIYDCPMGSDENAARIVSVWTVRRGGRLGRGG
jgi:Domain of unknown function (DUF4258)